MKDEIKKLLFDIKIAVNSIFEYLGDKRDFFVYSENKMLQRAIEREFEIIGEAMNKIIKMEPTIPVTHARRIIDLRNLVIHSYDRVDHAIIWGIICCDLPELSSEINQLLDKE